MLVLRLLGIVISIAAADAVNPSTLIPALYLASGQEPGRQVLRFSAGVLAVYVSAGLILTLGPGELILDLVPRPGPRVEDWLQVAAGSVLLLGGLVVWRLRRPLARRQTSSQPSGARDGERQRQRPSLRLGAGIAAVGLPTNVAYLGAITTIVGSDRSLASQLLLVVVYDVIFGLPLAGILVILRLSPQRSARLLGALRRTIQTRLLPVLVAVLLVASAVVLALGVTGLASGARALRS